MGTHLDVNAWRAYLGVDLLTRLRFYENDLREISDASRLPYARFPVKYEWGPLGGLPAWDAVAVPRDALQTPGVRRTRGGRAGQSVRRYGNNFPDSQTRSLMNR